MPEQRWHRHVRKRTPPGRAPETAAAATRLHRPGQAASRALPSRLTPAGRNPRLGPLEWGPPSTTSSIPPACTHSYPQYANRVRGERSGRGAASAGDGAADERFSCSEAWKSPELSTARSHAGGGAPAPPSAADSMPYRLFRDTPLLPLPAPRPYCTDSADLLGHTKTAYRGTQRATTFHSGARARAGASDRQAIVSDRTAPCLSHDQDG
jgi:hypothetical protein